MCLVARQGGNIAGDARKAIEKRTGEPVITAENAIDFSLLIADMIDGEDGDGIS